jgi:hypothetical protein
MRTCVSVFGCLVLTIVAGHVGLADEDKKKPAEAPKEQTVVDYNSKTHGAVQVKSASENPGDSFNVLPEGKKEFLGQPEILNGTRELAPGTYMIDVNRTRRTVKVEAGKKTVLLTGDLVVESKREGTIWSPRQEKEFKYASNPPVVNTRLALFAGTYEVYINVGNTINLKEFGKAEVKAGAKTVFKE